ncbi:cytochrome b5 reductase 4 [Octopus bimaculoides]|uniref:Cytochrome b5 reductase 4 n=1 Tax=Octopus bimaculoides TaxID=37653 RepID=A0A0L8GC15_OCTBM|nr:cytochrome b5 reductase 4 [Octopus bimaculoides]XP_014782335.1 cytochrome b5 reductase 4 [Octopus bimaculoides]XP_014782336.1 cytochrome b5 reductase 4 [Octopus bimaculoides]XP_014782337.1 cytochrome b5 reductase 4 [Octopus bimaculoides]XP_014782338.1 cytochrome b5 reductase 4 [Octopus bimaculoides]|eukprot:XP_014782334.1 PREDICTED: cytochrome b5 reductase 4-like [Octopus bimaculoides]
MDKSVDKQQAAKNMIPQFPAANSQQRSSSSSMSSGGRNKVALKECRSLMDWIRLSRSGEDLTGIGGKVIDVTPEELRKHNTENDAWMAIRGRVYNVTPYMEYHPGGIAELMRGVGKDGTQLFDEIHRWVNVNSMLEKCYIGQLKSEQIFEKKNFSSRLNFPTPVLPPVFKEPPATSKQPSSDWFQSETSVTVVLYTHCTSMKSEYVIVDRNDNDLHLYTFIKPKMFKMHINLTEEITSTYKVTVMQSGAVQIVLKKENPLIHWPSLGEILEQNFTKTHPETLSRDCIIDTVKQLTHDTKLFRISLPEGCLMTVPIGFHLRVYHTISDTELYRQYTLVLPSMQAEDQDMASDQGHFLYLMIKIYEQGALTSWINTLKSGSSIKLSLFEGNFDETRLEKCSHLILFAAGTGITPMIRLIYYALNDPKKNIRCVNLIFFNKTQEDIIWREEFNKLSNQDERFQVKYVLSQPDSQWSSPVGHLNEELANQHIPPFTSLVDQNMLICACGPSPFTANTMRLARLQGYGDQHIHPFLG